MDENYRTEYQYTTEPPKKKGKMRTVVALVALVAVVGGASGFGGAYLAGSMNGGIPLGGGEIWNQGNGTFETASDHEKNLPNDVSAALEVIRNSNTASTGASASRGDTVTPTGLNGQYTAEELYEVVNDTIVLINIYASQQSSYSSYYDYYFGYGGEKPDQKSEPVLSGYASGIVFTEDGYILTNAHVVDDAERVEVIVNDYEDSESTHTYEAEIIGSDTSTDIAVIKISRTEPFRTAKIGDSDSLKVGQTVCAIGNPGVNGSVMFTHTMTQGIISGLNRISLSTGYSTSYIQTDAAINSGNSGGALFDMYGNVVGVVNKKIVYDTVENIGFAITINEAKPVMEDLLSYGYVKSRPVLGITTIELNEYRAQAYGTKLSKGLLVTEIRQDAAVSKSELRLSDIITKINGKNVETVTDVQGIIKNMKAGDKIKVTVAREKENGTLDSVELEIELSESAG